MKKITTLAMFATIAAAIVSACSSQDKTCYDSDNPSECQAVVDAGGNTSDYLMYGMAGYMLANMNGNRVIIRDQRYNGPSRYNPKSVVKNPRSYDSYKKAEASRIERSRIKRVEQERARQNTSFKPSTPQRTTNNNSYSKPRSSYSSSSRSSFSTSRRR